MNVNLVVVRPFAKFAKGDVITETAAVARVMSSENASHVVHVAARGRED